MNQEQIKMLIELSPNVEEADKIIENENFHNVREKIAFLKGMFDFKLIGRYDDSTIQQQESQEMDYYAILSTIINSKWEA